MGLTGKVQKSKAGQITSLSSCDSESISINFPAPFRCYPGSSKSLLQATTTTDRGSWQHFNLFCCKRLHWHSPLGENRQKTQAGCWSKGKASQEQQLLQLHSAASQSQTPQLKALTVWEDLRWYAVFLPSPVPLHAAVSIKTGWDGNVSSILTSISIWWVLAGMNKAFYIPEVLQETEHWGIHPYASYSLLRFSGFLCWIPREKKGIFIILHLKLQYCRRQQHRIYRLATVLTGAYWKNGDSKATATAASSLVLHVLVCITATSGIPKHTCFCCGKWDLDLQ